MKKARVSVQSRRGQQELAALLHSNIDLGRRRWRVDAPKIISFSLVDPPKLL